jgi:AsmA protein
MLASTDTGADIKTQMQFTDVDLESCLGEMFNIRRIEGRGNMGFEIEASGGSVLALAQNLNGSASLEGRDGAVSRLNAEQMLQRFKRRPLSGAGDYRNGRTTFEKLIISLKIASGNATIEDARLEGAKLRIAVTGSSMIPTRDLDLRGSASLLENGRNDAAPTLELPFVVRGTWEDPLPVVDTQILIERSPSAGPLLEALKRRNAPPPADQPTGGSNENSPANVPAAPLAAEPVGTAPATAPPQ